MQPSAQRFAICRAVVLRLPSRGRYLGPGRRREARAERPGVPAGPASQASARQLLALRLTEVRRQAASFRRPAVRQRAASFRQQAAYQEAGPGAVADHPELSSARHPRRAALLRRDAAEASSVLRRQEASKALQRPAARSAMVSRSALPWGLRSALPAPAWYQPAAYPEAGPGAVARPEVSSWCCLQRAAMRSAQAWGLPPAEAAYARAEPQQAAALVSDAGAAQRRAAASDAEAVQRRAVPAVLVASAQPPVAAREEVSAVAAARQRVVPAAVRDAAEEPQQAAEPAEVPGAEAEPRPVAARAVSVASRPAAARPLAAPWAFRRDRVLPWPVRRPVARFARAMRMSRSASPSERSWQAARCEGLS
ncbi:hypothetical protein [Bradyrhizobium sp. AUGA SZCCT0431]|uniref:hypothetical protein n=1 Tax=Bradyrhizobium sp. AUGA SZCCT0431 TaxID=2807674 RepID=UPI0039089033